MAIQCMFLIVRVLNLLVLLGIPRLTLKLVSIGSWLERFKGVSRVQYWDKSSMSKEEDAAKISRKDSDVPLWWWKEGYGD